MLRFLRWSTFYIALYARLTRAAMLEVQRQDYVRTARARYKAVNKRGLDMRPGLADNRTGFAATGCYIVALYLPSSRL